MVASRLPFVGVSASLVSRVDDARRKAGSSVVDPVCRRVSRLVLSGTAAAAASAIRRAAPAKRCDAAVTEAASA